MTLHRNRGETRGFGLVEAMGAVLLIAIVAAAAAATWGMSATVVRSKRLTEMANFIGTREIERIKAKTYTYAAVTTSPYETYYDKYGATTSAATAGGYLAKTYVLTFVQRASSPGSSDINEIRVQVWSADGTTRYDDGNIRTQLSLGAI